jgi:DNA repair photolyase
MSVEPTRIASAPASSAAAPWARVWIPLSATTTGAWGSYQPLEASYQLTRRCLEVCLEFSNPVGVVTKGPLVARDIDVLTALAGRASVSVTLSVPFLDDDMGRRIEPYAARPSKRFDALAQLSAAGLRTGLSLSPVIPGLNDSQIPQILARARECGATFAFMTMLRLPGEVLPVFTERLQAAEPLRHGRVLSAIRDIREGGLNTTEFGARMTGAGPRWQAIEQLFRTHARRLGFDADPPREPAREAMRAAPAPRARPQQRSLFDDD